MDKIKRKVGGMTLVYGISLIPLACLHYYKAQEIIAKGQFDTNYIITCFILWFILLGYLVLLQYVNQYFTFYDGYFTVLEKLFKRNKYTYDDFDQIRIGAKGFDSYKRLYSNVSFIFIKEQFDLKYLGDLYNSYSTFKKTKNYIIPFDNQLYEHLLNNLGSDEAQQLRDDFFKYYEEPLARKIKRLREERLNSKGK